MVLLQVSAIIGAPKMTMSASNFDIQLLLASNFNISAVYGSIGLYFGYDALMGLCYNISRAHGPISRFWAPKTTKCPFCMQIFLNIASKFLSMLFRDQFCCALNMMLLCVSAIIALELMALSLGLGALGDLKIFPCLLNVLCLWFFWCLLYKRG